MNNKRRRRAIRFALGVLLVILAGLAIMYQRVDARSQIDGARRADAIIVLGTTVWPGGRPSPALNARTQHAIALYQAGYASHLILCGGVGGNPPSEAEVMRQLAVSAGVPADALVLEDQSHSTIESLANAKRLMDTRGWRNAVIVSDPFHLYRAEAMARDLGIEAYGSGANASPTYARTNSRLLYTARETLALVWYYTTRVIGEPTWLYGILKGRI